MECWLLNNLLFNFKIIKRLTLLLILLFSPFMLFSNPLSPARAPYGTLVSGDAFRACCDYVFDETDSSLNPSKVKPHSSIFVKGDYLDQFFHRIHPYLSHPYVLVTHNSDQSAPGRFSSVLQEAKLVAWFSQNVDDDSHCKMHPIPIGIANRCWRHGNGDLITKIRSKQNLKKHLVYLNISVETYPQERGPVQNLLKNASFVYDAKKKPFNGYLIDLASCKFVASPRGNGLDTHRLWESLYLGSYPIVKTSTLDSLYDELPVLIVQDWNEVTEDFLNQKYDELCGKSYNFEKLNFSYWINLINHYKEK